MLHVAGAIADAVGAAHAKGIVHRDLKPDNVFLATDATAPFGFAVKILDFGIAKLLGKETDGGAPVSARTRTGSLMGTPAYMSPEQCRGASRVDHRTDIYSLGCIVYEMLAGRLPFVYEGFGELIAAHLTEAPPAFASFGVAVPAGIETWVRRLLAKVPDERIATMADVIVAIRALERAPGVVAALRAPPTPLPPTMVASSKTSPATTFTAQAAERFEVGGPPRRRLAPLVLGGVAVAAAVAVWLGRGAAPPAAVTPPPLAAVAAPPTMVTFTVSDAPAELSLWVDGKPGALPLRLPAGGEVHELTFRAPGYKERVLQVDASANRLLTLAMQPEPVAAPPPPAEAPPARRSDAHKHRSRTPREGSDDPTDDARKL